MKVISIGDLYISIGEEVFCNTLRIQEEHVLKVKNKYLRTVNIKWEPFLNFHFF